MQLTLCRKCFFILTLTILTSSLYSQENQDKNKKMSMSDKARERLKELQIESLEETKKLSALFVASETTIDSTFNAVAKEYQKDKLFITNLTEAQRLWKLLRDADIKSIYPNESPNYYGQVNTDCVYHILIAKNAERLKFINQWLVGIREGDVCAGFLKWIR